MSQSSSMFVAGDIIQTILGAFFLGHPVAFQTWVAVGGWAASNKK